jgi:hypothetical protein
VTQAAASYIGPVSSLAASRGMVARTVFDAWESSVAVLLFPEQGCDDDMSAGRRSTVARRGGPRNLTIATHIAVLVALDAARGASPVSRP